MPHPGPPPAGFTLVELSIVLVVIGLLAGGVLVGQDLIHAAKIRKTITVKDQLDAAALTFRLKFNALAGDMTNYGDYSSTNFNCAGASNGDGMVDARQTSTGLQDAFYGNPMPYCTESHLFPLELKDANLINISGQVWASTSNVPGKDFPDFPLYPRDAAFVTSVRGVAAGNGSGPVNSPHYYHVLASNHAWGTGTVQYGQGSATPSDAQAIDAKIDDGFPYTGAVRAVQSGNWLSEHPNNFPVNGQPGTSHSPCVFNNGQYDVLHTLAGKADYRGCLLIMRAAF